MAVVHRLLVDRSLAPSASPHGPAVRFLIVRRSPLADSYLWLVNPSMACL